jgi:dihydroorotase
MYDLVLRDGRLMCSGGEVRGDLGVEGGRIAAIGSISGRGRRELALGGRAVLPGVIDTHVHFRTPGATHKETWVQATRAALVGGTTSVVDMPNTEPLTIDALALGEKAALVAREARCNYGFFVGATPDNLDALLWLEETAAAYCGIKIFMGASTGRLLVADPGALEAIFARTRRVIAVHAESNRLLTEASAPYRDATQAMVHGLARPREAALVAVREVLALSRAHRHPVHLCHLTTREELALLEADSGLAERRVSAETCPHYLAFDASRTQTHGNFAKMNPPLREPADCEALWEGLGRGVVGMVNSDHAPHLPEEKAAPYHRAPSGVPGVETALRYLAYQALRRDLDLGGLGRLLATAQADRFGIRGKGRIQVGWDADLVVLSTESPAPYRREEVLSRCGWSLFEGEILGPAPEWVVLGGRVVAGRGKILDDDPLGAALRFDPVGLEAAPA